MVNSVFGKTLENPKNYGDYRVAINEDQYHDNMRKSTLKRFVDIGDDTYLFEHSKRQVKIVAHNLLGATCTESGRRHMIKVYYGYFKPRKLELRYTDTNSFLMSTNGMTMIEALTPINDQILDSSNLDPTHPLYSTNNKGILGYFKNEYPKETIVEYCGLRPKTYSLLMLDSSSS